MARNQSLKDPFSIKIRLRHPSRSPESISKALSLKPELAWAVGDRRGKSRARWKMTFFSAYLQKGKYASEYADALENVVQFLEKNAAFWPDFTGENGEAELILNHQINGPWKQGD